MLSRRAETRSLATYIHTGQSQVKRKYSAYQASTLLKQTSSTSYNSKTKVASEEQGYAVCFHSDLQFVVEPNAPVRRLGCSGRRCVRQGAERAGGLRAGAGRAVAVQHRARDVRGQRARGVEHGRGRAARDEAVGARLRVRAVARHIRLLPCQPCSTTRSLHDNISVPHCMSEHFLVACQNTITITAGIL